MAFGNERTVKSIPRTRSVPLYRPYNPFVERLPAFRIFTYRQIVPGSDKSPGGLIFRTFRAEYGNGTELGDSCGLWGIRPLDSLGLLLAKRTRTGHRVRPPFVIPSNWTTFRQLTQRVRMRFAYFKVSSERGVAVARRGKQPWSHSR